MSATAIADALVEQLRALPQGAKPHMGEIRRAIGCTNADLKLAVERLRYAGKLHWERIELAPSMLLQPAALVAPVLTGPEPHIPSAADIPPAAEEEAASCVPASPPPRPDERLRRTGLAELEQARLRSAAAAITVAEPTAKRSIAEEVQAEATENVRRRRSAGTLAQPWKVGPARRRADEGDLSLPEKIQTLLTDTPADVIRAVERRHPALWRRAVLLGRARGVLPSVAMFDALDRGLALLERDQVREAARG